MSYTLRSITGASWHGSRELSRQGFFDGVPVNAQDTTGLRAAA